MFFHELEPQIYEFLITVGVLLIATLLILTFFISTPVDFVVRRCFKVSGISLAGEDFSILKKVLSIRRLQRDLSEVIVFGAT